MTGTARTKKSRADTVATADAVDPSSADAPGLASVNEIHLLGRLADAPLARELPSGDPLVTFRLIVDRPPDKRRAPLDPPRRTPTVDTLDCVAWKARERSRLLACAPGAQLEVWGTLRRRFYRGPAGLGSRYEVSVERVTRARGG